MVKIDALKLPHIQQKRKRVSESLSQKEEVSVGK
jgi:hypothetical protein